MAKIDVDNIALSREIVWPAVVAGTLAMMLALVVFAPGGIYGSQRLGKSRLVSILTGQKSVRWSIDELTDKGYMEVCTSISNRLCWPGPRDYALTTFFLGQ